MVEQFIVRQPKMQQPCTDVTFQQSTMMQQFCAVLAMEEDNLPPQGWMRMWDNPVGWHYYFNTIDHDIQYDRVKVFEIAALEAGAKALESLFRDESMWPDGVVSSSNNTITISPFLARRSGGRYDKEMPAKTTKPLSFGGFFTIDNIDTEDDDDEVTIVPPPTATNRKKARKTSPMKANHLSVVIPQVVFGSVPAFTALESGEDGDKPETEG